MPVSVSPGKPVIEEADPLGLPLLRIADFPGVSLFYFLENVNPLVRLGPQLQGFGPPRAQLYVQGVQGQRT